MGAFEKDVIYLMPRNVTIQILFESLLLASVNVFVNKHNLHTANMDLKLYYIFT